MTTEQLDSGDICTACGLCCDGTLFTRLELGPDEVESARQAGLDVITVREQPSVRQPCVQLCGTRCGVYARRPRTCRTFECATLKAVKAGQVSTDEAGKRIAQARAALEKVRPEFLPGETFSEAHKRFRQAVAASATVSASPMFRLHMGALALLLDKYFRLPEGQMFSHKTGAEKP